jgi:hypothetical protein
VTWLHAGEAGVHHAMWIGLEETYMESDDAGRYLERIFTTSCYYCAIFTARG